MLFNSIHFILFFPLVVFAYFALKPKYRTWLLLAASYYFYMCWKVEYILLIVVSTVIDFYVAQQIAQIDSKQKKKKWLYLSLGVNLGILFFFKYFNFFSSSLQEAFAQVNIFYDSALFDFLLPVGISFYTFQTLSYTIDVYNGKLEPERDFWRFALFVSFFPQLVAGPIERATHLLPQFRKSYDFDYNRIVSGLRLMLWGFFKKVVIADRLALIVNQVYNQPDEQNGITYLIATIFFSFQIYCDFSGYSDIAIGSARVMGFDLMTNFRQPYLSRSIREFWSRWHISLSTWFRDYVYIPLGGNRTVKWRWYYNLFITFLISGLWHGANWTFVIWGSLHGIYLVLEIIIKTPKFNFTDAIQFKHVPRVLMTIILVMVTWVFFRANTVGDAAIIVQKIVFNSHETIQQYLNGQPVFLGFGQFPFSTVILYLGLCGLLYLADFLLIQSFAQKLFFAKSWVRWIVYFVLFYSILLGGYFGETEFIYFQF